MRSTLSIIVLSIGLAGLAPLALGAQGEQGAHEAQGAQQAQQAQAVHEEARVEVTYLGNEGFFVRSGENKVLIDALYGEGLPEYEVVPADARRKLQSAEAPFDGVDLILVTHDHSDHFDPVSIANTLEANPDALCITTEEALESMRITGRQFERIKDRISGKYPATGEVLADLLGEVPLMAFRLPHGEVQQLGFVIQVGGMRLLHLGDTDTAASVFKKYRLHEEKVDVAFVPFWYFQYAQWKLALKSGIKADRIVAMHFPSPGAPEKYFGKAKNLEELYAGIEKEFPEVVIFKQPLEKRTFDRKDEAASGD